MTYFRLRDIRTPPFAYVMNREDVTKLCPLCRLPFRELLKPLKVEIFTTDVANWRQLIVGKPLMAEHWLIGDTRFAERLEELLPGMFQKEPVEIVSWLTRDPHKIMTPPGKQGKDADRQTLPDFYYFFPVHQVKVDSDLMVKFPPIPCSECKREIPDIPFDYQLMPDTAASQPHVASLQDLYLEGYDYLLHNQVVGLIQEAFPEMILENLDWEPSLF